MFGSIIFVPSVSYKYIYTSIMVHCAQTSTWVRRCVNQPASTRPLTSTKFTWTRTHGTIVHTNLIHSTVNTQLMWCYYILKCGTKAYLTLVHIHSVRLALMPFANLPVCHRIFSSQHSIGHTFFFYSHFDKFRPFIKPSHTMLAHIYRVSNVYWASQPSVTVNFPFLSPAKTPNWSMKCCTR